MKKLRYLCLDDKPNEVRLSLRRLCRASSRLHIDVEAPLPFKKQAAALAKLRAKGRLDGVIVDLRLDQSAPAGEQPVDYKAQGLASYLRTKMAEGALPDFPLVLWSISSLMAASYNKDAASHDLFDLTLDKEKLLGKEAENAVRLESLVLGYEKIAAYIKDHALNLGELLRIPKKLILDPRVGAGLLQTRKPPIHVIARYVLQKLILTPGPLIDKATLCARLGVQEKQWYKTHLAETIDQLAGYHGPFAEAWPRWWWPAVEQWWQAKAKEKPSILSLNAQSRVVVLKRFSRDLKLPAAKPIDSGYSSRFTTICQHLQKPLDPLDGFMLESTGFESWQDRLYVSRDVALRPGFHGFHRPLDPLEKVRRDAQRSKK